jgi:hypothetical protein
MKFLNKHKYLIGVLIIWVGSFILFEALFRAF